MRKNVTEAVAGGPGALRAACHAPFDWAGVLVEVGLLLGLVLASSWLLRP